jgi:hypothetical protein
MPATPIYALPYPASSDPADVPLDMQKLADRIEAGGVPGAELAYAQITAAVNVTATAEASATVIVTAPAITIVAGQTILVEFFSQGVRAPDVAGNSITLRLYEDGTSLGGIVVISNPTTAVMIVPAYAARRRAPAAGSHTYSIRGTVSGANPAVVYAGAGGAGVDGPAFIRISRI